MKTLSRLFRYGALASAVVGVTPLVTPLAAAAQDAPVALPDILVTASRLGAGVTGSSTTVITAEDIARAPDATVQDLLGRVPGIQTWSTGGGINGAGTVVDMRGFGATAASNTLVLINGRRLTDIDLAGVDFSSIPRQSIERIEITRGNSGAVLYGDGAVGGVINIITKNGVGSPATGRIEGGFGSFQQREGTVSAAASNGTFATSVYGTAIDSNGYRVNNALRQRDAVGDIRYTGSDGTAYLNVSGDDQHLGLPGPRRVTLTSSELATDPTGATTPTAFADKKGANLTLGVTRAVAKDFEIVLDGGVRNKKQDAFSTLFGFTTSDARELKTL
jgi:iron complex outermembrane receptor protein